MDVANGIVQERNNYMAIYLHDFMFRSAREESDFYLAEKRTCFNSFYPLDIFPQKGLGRVDFEPVTIFYGGNGSGKSTMLNIIAARLNVLREIPFKPGQFFDWYVNGLDRCVNGTSQVKVPPLSFNSELGEEWKGIPAESRILTSEDVFDKTLTVRGRNREIDRQRDMVAQKWWAYNVEGKHTNMTSMHGPEYEAWKMQHSMRDKSMSKVIKEEVGFNIKTGSNGENAFEFFMEKVQGNALYLLDEPENSLSAAWQVKLASYLEGMARFEGCQFVIATHSPFLLGIRGAKIYDLDTDGVPVRKWTELENVRQYYEFFRERMEEFS